VLRCHPIDADARLASWNARRAISPAASVEAPTIRTGASDLSASQALARAQRAAALGLSKTARVMRHPYTAPAALATASGRHGRACAMVALALDARRRSRYA
jgi:hypothetical protein